jgi:hypothetical protein
VSGLQFNDLSLGPAGKPVSIVDVQIANYGNRSISPDDFQGPLVISFGSESCIASAAITHVCQRDLCCDLTVDQARLAIAPVLLNKGDAFVVKALVADYDKTTVSCHVRGVPRITRRRNPSTTLDRVQAFNLLLMGAMLMLGVVMATAPSLAPYPILGIFMGALVAEAILLLVFTPRPKGFSPTGQLLIVSGPALAGSSSRQKKP